MKMNATHWISYNLKENFSLGRDISYSISGRFVMCTIGKPGLFMDPCLCKKVLLIDLFANKKRLFHRSEWQDIGYTYWVNDSEIVVFSYCSTTESYIQFQYSVNFTTLELSLLTSYKQDCSKPYGQPLMVHKNSARNVSPIQINGQYFMMANVYDLLLLPYDLLTVGPRTPMVHIKIWPNTWEGTDRLVFMEDAFFWKDHIFFAMCKSRSLQIYFDKLCKIDLSNMDLLTKEKEISNREDVTFFELERVSDGTFASEDRPMIWQDGPIVVFFDRENPKEKNAPRKLWILDLIRNQVSERTMENTRYSYATVNRGMLVLWRQTRHPIFKSRSSLDFTVLPLPQYLPKLKDLCSFKLMLLKIENPFVL